MLKIEELLEGKKAFLFDMDGTLINSMGIWHDIDLEYLAGFGIKLPDDLQKCLEGMCFHDTAVYIKNRFNLPVHTDEMEKAWNEMAHYKYAHDVSFKPGVEKLLNYAKSNGIKMAIGTSNSRYLYEAVSDSLGFERYFDCVITGDETKKSKPDPEIYILLANKLNVNPEECLVFEDTVAGLNAGLNAGMEICGIYDIYSDYCTEEKRNISGFFIDDYEKIIYSE
ncbi:MAG: HAD family phosphatase [Lachnospiraceae bacterium]|nr:HAD family phosphatase [Lachnospiraceae bacterium]